MRTPDTEDDVVHAGPWSKGIQNRVRAYSVEHDAVRNAVNVDIGVTGHISRRNGYTKVVGLAGTRCGYSCPAGVFFMAGQRLKRLNADNSVSDLGGITGEYVAFAYGQDGNIYLSDGEVTKRITNGVLHEWGIRVPSQPLANGVSGGDFPAGTYLMAFTFIDSDGRESGSSLVSQFTLVAAYNAILIKPIPMSGNSDVVAVRIYLSQVNGSQLFHAATVTPGATSYTLSTNDGGSGKSLNTLHQAPMPPGRIIREYRGRMLVADGNVLWISEPYAYDKIRLDTGFVQFAADITLLEPVEGGVFVAADKTYILSGTGPGDWRQSTVLEYGAVFGTSQIGEDHNPMWLSTRGVVVGGQNGSAKNITEDNVALDSGDSGAAMLRKADGRRQFTVSIKNPSISPLAASDWMTMEVVRRGTP